MIGSGCQGLYSFADAVTAVAIEGRAVVPGVQAWCIGTMSTLRYDIILL